MNRKKFPLAGTLLLASITALPIAALAAEQGAGAGGSIEEIVVTATKREHVQNVVSIAASPQIVREGGSTNIVDLARSVVGLSSRRSRCRPEPGRHPRHQRRPGDSRPARRQRAGRRLSR